MGQKVRLLVVDDEESIRDLLSIGLSHRGFEVKTAGDAKEALAEIGAFSPHAAIVDVMMPGEDGFQLTRRLRQDPNLYILMLTARDAVTDRIQGLDDGADDYLVKPFDFDELVARINAGLRRTHRGEESAWTFQNIRMDDLSHRVTVGDNLVQLTAKEYELLRYLLLNPGRVLSKYQILQHVWGYDFPGDDNLVEVHISSLRDKIRDRDKSVIQTVRGFGYRLGD